jgi:3-dehydroquinate synthetase
MDLVNHIAWRRGLLAEADCRRVKEFVCRHLPFTLSRPIEAGKLIAAARRDKKVADGQINLILAEKPGSLRVVKTPFDASLEGHITEYVEHHSVFATRQQQRRAA